MRTWLLALCLSALPLAAAERVISLAPSLSEIMLDLDVADLLVGVLEGMRSLLRWRICLLSVVMASLSSNVCCNWRRI